MTADRDPVVGALLDRLPVAPPAPAFWDDLRTRLESGDVVPLHPTPTGPSDPRRFRRRRVIVAASAAAAVLVAVVVGSALRDDRDHLDTRPPVTTPDEPSPTTVAPSTPEAAVLDAAFRWVHAVADDDADAVWALLGPQSRASVGRRAAFDELMTSTLRGTWPSLALRGPDAATALNMGSAAEPRWWLVAFEPIDSPGLVTPPDDDSYRQVLAVRLGPDLDDVSVEPFLPGPALSLIELPAITSGSFPLVDAEGPITVHVDADAPHFVVAVDGVAATEVQLERNGLGHVLSVRPSRRLSTDRTHTITVGMVLADGTIAADSKAFRVR